jgi:TatA/E family protein of Tat protein translocase
VDILLILVVILIIVLIWRGPTMLPRLGESLGKTIKGFRDNLPGASDDGRADPPGPDTPARP